MYFLDVFTYLYKHMKKYKHIYAHNQNHVTYLILDWSLEARCRLL